MLDNNNNNNNNNNKRPGDEQGIIEVDTENAFWYGGLYYCRDTNGDPLRLTKKEFQNMVVASEVIEIEAVD